MKKKFEFENKVYINIYIKSVIINTYFEVQSLKYFI